MSELDARTRAVAKTAPVAVRAEHVAKVRSRLAGKPLTPKEVEIAKHLCSDKSGKDIASELGLGVKTIDAHKYNLYAKLNVHSRPELMLRMHGAIDIKTQPIQRDQQFDRLLVRVIRLEGKIDALIEMLHAKERG